MTQRNTSERSLAVMKTVKYEIEKRMGMIQSLVESEMTAKRLLNIYLNTMSRNPTVLQCTPQSLVRAFMLSAELKLPIGNDAMALSYVVPFKNNKINAYEATYIPSYRGYIDLVRRYTPVVDIRGNLVYEKEIEQGRFTYKDGAKVVLEHEPILFGDKGKVVGGYCVAEYPDGVVHPLWMSYDEIEKVRASSKAKDSGPWVQWWEMMALKTIIRRLCKYIPTNPDSGQKLERAVIADTQADMGESQESLEAEWSVVDDSEDDGEPEPVQVATKSSRLASKISETQTKKEQKPEREPGDESENEPNLQLGFEEGD
jgi:recombination protein RecT